MEKMTSVVVDNKERILSAIDTDAGMTSLDKEISRTFAEALLKIDFFRYTVKFIKENEDAADSR